MTDPETEPSAMQSPMARTPMPIPILGIHETDDTSWNRQIGRDVDAHDVETQEDPWDLMAFDFFECAE
jgi:hypothetical protein